MAQSRPNRTSQRFTELDPSVNDAPFLEEYLQEPLVSLENALRNFRNDIINLDKYINDAKESCNRSSNHGLTYDESAAIYLYTIEWEEASQSLYFIMNNTLRLGNRSEKKQWFPYLRILVMALRKLPSVKINVWRIVRKDVGKNYSNGTTFVWPSITSCSADIGTIMKNFWNPDVKNTLFNIRALHGKDISAYSQFPKEEEFVLIPGTRFRVIEHSVLDNIGNYQNIPVIRLEEI